ncbi:transglutaminase domain-containing protein [Halomicrobium mukohataei]|uniref:Transglutaminase domain-containing protein n=1 Tax=Halomicrobium mukohataei TaxID=57705 RepID=A0A847UCU7_9EURY|nr:transglutaminase domain-containing protein [Halomicrobium mukohataei]
MSTADRLGLDWPAVESVGVPGRTRTAALVAVAALLGSTLQVLYFFIDVVGLPSRFLAVVAASLVAATVLARLLTPRSAVALGGVLLLVGLWWYVQQLSGSPRIGELLTDTLSLLTGNTLLRITNIRAWVLGVTPAPTFLTWYFAMRRRYALAVAAAGGTLGFLVLTGDADLLTTLSGVVAAVASLGFGDFDRRGEPIVDAETILVTAALMVVVPSLVSVVPATAGLSLNVDGTGSETVEASLLQSGDQLSVQGSISLSPEVRFTVTSSEPRYWRIGSFDRYTGDGWVSQTNSRAYGGGRLDEPPGPTRIVEQRFRAETDAGVMPAAWKPIQSRGNPATRVDGDGGLATGAPIREGDSYRVTSAVPAATPAQLNDTTRAYPQQIEETYTQLPASTPDRVGERTDRLTREARTPYETALTIENWLENNREYSLDVRRPDGNVADAFLFEMSAGYCTYYATTMATMLRTQDIPARMAVGYTSGERVAEDRWVVRGQNAHAWVEVYFEEYGWVRFDPTPASDRESARDRNVESARERDRPSVDTNESGGPEWSPTPTATPQPLTPVDSATDAGGTPLGPQTRPGVNPEDSISTATRVGEAPTGTVGTTTDRPGPASSLPSRREAALGLLAIVGTVIGMRRSDLGRRVYRSVWLYYQPRSTPERDTERAFQRLVYYLGREHDRPRRPDETVRAYLDAVDADERAREVASIRERARYAGTVDEAAADRAVSLVDEIVRSRGTAK